MYCNTCISKYVLAGLLSLFLVNCGDNASTSNTDASTSIPNPGADEDTKASTPSTETDEETKPSTEGDQNSDTSCAQVSDFLDLSSAPGPENGFTNSLKVTCTAEKVQVVTNNMPSYKFEKHSTTGPDLWEHIQTFTFPRSPQYKDSPTYAVNGYGMGRIAVAVNGIQTFTPIEAREPILTMYGDPFQNGLTDNCGGHTAANTSATTGLGFHLHKMVENCLLQENVASSEPWTHSVASTKLSPIVGYAADGFPIYGSYGCGTSNTGCNDQACSEIISYKSGWSLREGGSYATCAYKDYTYTRGTEPTTLDECNGHTDNAGNYHYHLTEDWPYHVFCLHGTPDSSLARQSGNNAPDCS